MDHSVLVKLFRDQGFITIREGNGKSITLIKPEDWKQDQGNEWIYLLFDLFQIRTISEQFSEVSLDIVEFASKPTIYSSPANNRVPADLKNDGLIRFSLIRDPDWNKFLFQLSQPVLAKLDSSNIPDVEIKNYFPLYGPNVKEIYLGAEGDVKIIKG
ncbi:hypothetical protein [Algoriphagus hitonicola]|uniref:Uncharacterized protein n=1 Tax=Algoriphagus hitonicola TaxID=435880 RepID=A0A1I2NKQ1_9BACT|nr:hypothetical protein [Algoriphagus hitonicola]SFG02036.1 hypothetical protein SAMN04487988_10164 [Algoriphagus hitonicola]